MSDKRKASEHMLSSSQEAGPQEIKIEATPSPDVRQAVADGKATGNSDTINVHKDQAYPQLAGDKS